MSVFGPVHFAYDHGGRPRHSRTLKSKAIQLDPAAFQLPFLSIIPAIQTMLYQNLITMLAASVLVVPVVQAHPGEVDQILTPRQLERRQADINARHAVVRNCDKEIKDFEVRRRARRSTQKHGNSSPPKHGNSSTKCSSAASGTETGTANTPTYTTLQNVKSSLERLIPLFSLVIRQTTCVLSPEGEEGPYYIVRILVSPFQLYFT
jgi:hypothetical protein